VEKCGPCPVFASLNLAFALQLRKKHGKPSVRLRKTSVKVQYTYYQNTHTLQNLSQGKKNLSQVKKNLSHNAVYILSKHTRITKPTQTQTLQNPHKQKITKPTQTHKLLPTII
jgi:tRNA pseudouridine-54 N-methylase